MYQPQTPVILKEGEYSPSDLEVLKQKQRIWATHEVYEDQLKGLYEITHPQERLLEGFHEAAVRFVQSRVSGSTPNGTWAYFPWSGQLVHMVNEDEYFQLRTNRNRNIITADEQQKLRNACVGIVGLSVGSNIAYSLVYQGIAETLKLAEFDRLETTNLNRIQAGVHQIGALKSDIVAHHIYEANPFQRLAWYERLTVELLKEFYESDPRPTVVFDENDDFEIKIRMRIAAREAGIPVIMLTNLGDSILIDVERYDLDHNLALFNGRIGQVPEEILKNPDISEEDKKKYAVGIVGRENIPQRVFESVMEINKTLVGRPQLSSTVTISGGVGAYLVRQFVLGGYLPSGRKLVSFQEFGAVPA